MTHTLHRFLRENEQSKDYVMFSMPAKGYNDHKVWDRVDTNYKIMHQCNAINVGGYDSGVFTNEKDLEKALAEIKKKDLGVSIIISGNFQNISEVCNKLDITPHTIEFSVGVFGKKELLCDDNILEVTTMCGHGLTSPNYVNAIVQKISKGKLKPLDGAKKLAKTCYCGVFNPERAAILLEKLAAQIR